MDIMVICTILVVSFEPLSLISQIFKHPWVYIYTYLLHMSLCMTYLLKAVNAQAHISVNKFSPVVYLDLAFSPFLNMVAS